ncbi:MAG TPA: DegT/DnrJ/EryC1/StrS family aminotransferase [Terriglobales bacterium]|nr:DegT/DnrJ/EryC1/StrS family aminotransferase [Terriglobales bacterium]
MLNESTKTGKAVAPKPLAISEITLTDGEIQAAVDVLRSGALRQGRQCEAFEREFAAYVGASHAVSSANGTAALHLAYMAFLNPGDEVLVPAFTFIATGSMVTAAGGRPVMCDVDPHTFLIDLADAERRLTQRTRAISPVHLFGNPCNVDAVQEFAARHDLRIVWDAAQAHGAKYHGRDVGSLGDFVTYSFYPTKNIFVGEGGMTCTNNAEYADRMRLFRSHGQSERYVHTALGLNYRMTDVEAAIGRKQLLRLNAMLAIRRRNAAILNARLARIPGIEPQRITAGGQHAWHQYSILVDEQRFGMNRDRLAARLQEEGISTGVHYPRGLHQQPIFQQLYGYEPLPVTERLAEQILALPVHHGLEEEDAHRIAETIPAMAR